MIKRYTDNSRGLCESNESMAEHERAQHEAGECLDGCPHCQAEVDAELESRYVFEKLGFRGFK